MAEGTPPAPDRQTGGRSRLATPADPSRVQCDRRRGMLPSCRRGSCRR